MKVIDTQKMEIVFSGKEWTHHSLLPCAKQAIPLLERNEKIVSWLKPKGGGVSDHIPAIFFKGKFYSLSLRMQKAIYRHIRLKKGFKNEEMMDGIAKLRIPDAMRKGIVVTKRDIERNNKEDESCDDDFPTDDEDCDSEDNHETTATTTTSRESVKENDASEDSTSAVVVDTQKKTKKRKRIHQDCTENNSTDDEHATTTTTNNNKARDTQLKKKGKKSTMSSIENDTIENNMPTTMMTQVNKMTTTTQASCKRERIKATCTVSARMKQVVDQMISCTQEQYNTAIQLTTVFAFKSHQSEIISCFLEEMRRENGALMNNKTALLHLVDEAYERSQKLIKMHSASSQS